MASGLSEDVMDNRGAKRASVGMKNRELRIAWSIAWLIVLGLFLPVFEVSRGANSTPAAPSVGALLLFIGLLVMAVVAWIPTRFSLRGLLILMTVVAITLGLGAWAFGGAIH